MCAPDTKVSLNHVRKLKMKGSGKMRARKSKEG